MKVHLYKQLEKSITILKRKSRFANFFRVSRKTERIVEMIAINEQSIQNIGKYKLYLFLVIKTEPFKRNHSPHITVEMGG
ncbi:hypothetical protein BHU24_06910 [Bacillus pseudomycoides]|nr:hypothetical protein [Bacillus pseudomycoides]PEO91018.1 hypothetical protein CN571_07880 [Bacillus pseudomycoides]